MADFGTLTLLDITLVSLANVEGTYKVLEAGTLTGAGNLVASTELIPFIFDSSLVSDHAERGFGHDPAKNG